MNFKFKLREAADRTGTYRASVTERVRRVRRVRRVVAVARDLGARAVRRRVQQGAAGHGRVELARRSLRHAARVHARRAHACAGRRPAGHNVDKFRLGSSKVSKVQYAVLLN